MSTTTTTTTNGAEVSDLRSRRLARGLTQAQLAIAAGVSINTVRNAETGLRIAPTTHERLERAFAEAA